MHVTREIFSDADNTFSVACRILYVMLLFSVIHFKLDVPCKLFVSFLSAFCC